ncbi:mechanosensitive ion channel family protein [Flavobacterium glaciei]|uniref:Mechanosensitive ion channel-like protein n=1 Tax=Flavobacterium glaciei TaxID=386300 RepID=A0A562PR39_9FLAO|nr:mechanosensitive ion channel domain-containing protein [Flavobacterium glaciei]RDI53697.1 mechanosensitive ion channel-like protein [Flavobacterium glaciei]TWI46924.1 mechanosensitive ion channel-like protein [Flavobacterium glaciei]
MEVLNKIIDLFGLSIIKTKDVNLTVGALIALVVAFMLTSYILKFVSKVITRNIPIEDKNKFVSIFQFVKYLVYLFVIMFTLNASGVNISVLLTASAAIFLGLGFALQQLFQDLISGILIILEQSLKVGDIIEVEGKVCRVEKISLRSTKAVTRNQRVMIIPNHKFLSDVLFNWTQNSTIIRESVEVGVAYGSDTELVKEILISCAKNNSNTLDDCEPIVMFENFGDSSLDFAVYFFVDDAFTVLRVKSELRFEIDKQFRINNITIPFPQRDVHFLNPNA